MPGTCLIILGCPKNIVEGEQMAGICSHQGITLTTSLESADTVVIHTCSFIQDARRESVETIRRMAALKKAGKIARIFVTGCLVQDEQDTIADEFPAVDGFAGTGGLKQITALLSGKKKFICPAAGGLLESSSPRLLSSSLPSAYLRIAEGCSHRCSFCSIPRLRGGYVSRRMEHIVREARSLADCGIQEIVLVAQDTTSYGYDRYGRFALPELIRRLSAIHDIRWIRLLYAYPSSVTSELIDLFNTEKKLCAYIDMPLQHISRQVLSAMRRPLSARRVVEHLKDRVPGIALRSTVIVGFPGESERDFRELTTFVSEGWFEHLGVFAYSPSRSTAAACLKGQIPEREKRARRNEVMRIQKKIVAAHNRARIGSSEEILAEHRVLHNGKPMTAGRARFQAPEIDSAILCDAAAEPGIFTRVRITGVSGYDLLAAME